MIPPPHPNIPYAKVIRAQTFIGWCVGFTAKMGWVKGGGGFGRVSGHFWENAGLVLSEREIGFGQVSRRS